MYTPQISKFSALALGLLMFFTSQGVYADTASVTSLTASTASMNSHQVVTFLWTIQGGGYSFMVPCVQGIKLQKDGATFACNTKVSFSTAGSDGVTLAAINTSGATRSFIARVIPKDASGNEYDAGKQEISVSVIPVQDPIQSFTSSATTTTVSGVLTTLSWTTQDIDGVNMVFDCKDNVRVTSTSYAPGGFIPCGTTIFSSDLGASGSIPFQFMNNTPYEIPFTARLFPTIAPGIYDGTHVATVSFSIGSDILPDPVTDSFTASASTITPGTPVVISWSTYKSDGANIQIGCNDRLTAYSVTGSATTTLPCNTPAFGNPLAATSTISISFSNSSFTTEFTTVSIFPLRKGGGYDATRGKQIALAIRSSQAPSTTQGQSPGGTTVPSTNKKYLFTKALSRGSRGADVTALQEFLKNDPIVYPSGTVSGYYGALTEQAVKKFQVKYGVASSGVVGYGNVGPKTRAKLNSLQ